MHQHPRRSPVTASPANSPRTNPARTNNSRDRERPSSIAGSDRGTYSEQSTSTGGGAEAMLRSTESSAPGYEQIGKLNQMVQNYFTKAALTVLNARVPLPPAYKDKRTKRVSKWFNVEIDETDVLKDHLRIWRECDCLDYRPPPLILETYIDTQELPRSQSLVYIDDNGKKWDVEEALSVSPSSDVSSDERRPEVILERWVFQLDGEPMYEIPLNMGRILPHAYKKAVVLFRSLFTCVRLFPAWRIGRKSFQSSRTSTTTPKLRFRISQDPKLDPRARQDNLTVPLYDGQEDVVESFAFDAVDSPAGLFSIHVTHRTSCDFRLDDAEAFLSSRFMGIDAAFSGRPSARRLESAPTRGNYMNEEMPYQSKQQGRPSIADQAHAYGSLSTFHQLEGRTSTSPVSALRAADFALDSPEDQARKTQTGARSGQGSRSSLRTAEGGVPGRRPSVSFMPFKTPLLSASPSQAEQTGTSYPRGSSLGKSSPLAALDEARHPAGPVPPRGSPKADHHRTPSSNSPKPPAPQRYSSSFGHRKAKLSTGGSKTEDDTSSGKASVSSAQPGSGVLAEGGTSSGSIQTDDDNISDFLKMLDQKKDLKSFSTSPQGRPSDAATRRTTAALSKYQRMKESNSALSESISTSQLLHRSSSSSSRQLGSVPQMVAPTSLSTSSSPGKPMSPHTPHTPHTPAIRSRLSANSVADYTRPQGSERRSRATLSESTEPTDPPLGAIDIPTSPRPFHTSYRRSSSAAQGHRTLPPDEDEIFPFFMRSASLGLDDRPPPSRSALIGDGQRDEFAVGVPSVENRPTFGPPLNPAGASLEGQQPAEGQEHSSAFARRGFPFRSHLGRGRGDTPPQGSSSSLADRGSPSGSEGHRTSRYSFSRPTSTFEDEEPLLFAMSDFDTVQQGRRSRESLRNGETGRGSRGGGSM